MSAAPWPHNGAIDVKAGHSSRDFLLSPAPSWNERLTQAREAKGIHKRKLSQAVSVSPPTVTDWESGEIKAIDAAHLLSVARELDVSPEWLLTGSPTHGDLGKLDTARMTSAERRLFEAFRGLTASQQEDAITKMENTRQQNARQFAELMRISDLLHPSDSRQTDLFTTRN